MGIPNSKLPEFLQDIQVDPADRERFTHALGNGVYLAKFLAANRDTLTPHDCLVMMKIETESPTPRSYILDRIKGRFDIERRYVESTQLVGMFT